MMIKLFSIEFSNRENLLKVSIESSIILYNSCNSNKHFRKRKHLNAVINSTVIGCERDTATGLCMLNFFLTHALL